MTPQAAPAPAPQPSLATVAVPKAPEKPLPFSIGALPEPKYDVNNWDPAAQPGCITVSSHSGHCCGMNTIYTFPLKPDQVVQCRPALTPDEIKARNLAAPGCSYNQSDYYPRQLASDRLKTAVHRIEARRPRGIIEVVLTATQTQYWRKTLEDEGFKEVNSARNSNSGNTIVVFHKVTGQ